MEIQRRENRCILKIKNCQPEDEADYSCTCGDVKTSTQFTVTGKDVFLLQHDMGVAWGQILPRQMVWGAQPS